MLGIPAREFQSDHQDVLISRVYVDLLRIEARLESIIYVLRAESLYDTDKKLRRSGCDPVRRLAFAVYNVDRRQPNSSRGKHYLQRL